MWTTDCGRLLLLKLVLFIGMLALAAANRFRHTPTLSNAVSTQLGGPADLHSLRGSVVLEAVLGFTVFALAAWFGTLPPPASHST